LIDAAIGVSAVEGWNGVEAEIAGIGFDDGRSADVWTDDFFGCGDLFAIE
jgi:hypothetical protein